MRHTMCATPGCWQEMKTSGFCAACYNSWRRMKQMSMAEFSLYLRKVTRLKSRAVTFSNTRRRRAA